MSTTAGHVWDKINKQKVSSGLILNAHNWQEWRSIFLTYPCHEINGEEAVDLKSSHYTLNITIFVNILNMWQFRLNLIFCK